MSGAQFGTNPAVTGRKFKIFELHRACTQGKMHCLLTTDENFMRELGRVGFQIVAFSENGTFKCPVWASLNPQNRRWCSIPEKPTPVNVLQLQLSNPPQYFSKKIASTDLKASSLVAPGSVPLEMSFLGELPHLPPEMDAIRNTFTRNLMRLLWSDEQIYEGMLKDALEKQTLASSGRKRSHDGNLIAGPHQLEDYESARATSTIPPSKN
ncbi:unnamed protein product [Caenorhabditis sp. 36 PRJEB53466]|nr:unnamed protein product [Caenorhabditis sp. 36 PRJEB53466]